MEIFENILILGLAGSFILLVIALVTSSAEVNNHIFTIGEQKTIIFKNKQVLTLGKDYKVIFKDKENILIEDLLSGERCLMPNIEGNSVRPQQVIIFYLKKEKELMMRIKK